MKKNKYALSEILFKCSYTLAGVAGSLVHIDTLDDVEEDVFYFDPAPVDQDVLEGGEARLRCDVSSRRMIMFYWTLNDKPVVNNSRRYQDNSDLRVVRADRHLDAGSFRCVATNVSTGIALRSAEARLNIFCESSCILNDGLPGTCFYRRPQYALHPFHQLSICSSLFLTNADKLFVVSVRGFTLFTSIFINILIE